MRFLLTITTIPMPGIVQEWNDIDGRYFIITERVSGQPLNEAWASMSAVERDGVVGAGGSPFPASSRAALASDAKSRGRSSFQQLSLSRRRQWTSRESPRTSIDRWRALGRDGGLTRKTSREGPPAAAGTYAVWGPIYLHPWRSNPRKDYGRQGKADRHHRLGSGRIFPRLVGICFRMNQ